MKISPLKKYRTPNYPSMVAAELDTGLLARIPARWRNSPGFVAVLGLMTGFATRMVLADDGSNSATTQKATVSQAPVTPPSAKDQSWASQEVQRATSVVAPILQEALQYDGRGAFGCIAINPPTFLSEDEALELIRTELEAVGLKLSEDAELADVESPVVGGWREKTELAPKTFAFDLADTNRAVFIEYLSGRDHTDWIGHSMSTVSSYDFPDLARKVSKSFQKTKTDRRTVFGVFFDPLASAKIDRPQVTGLSPSQQRLAHAEYAKSLAKEREHLTDKAKAKLRKQVQYFVEFLKKEGMVGALK